MINSWNSSLNFDSLDKKKDENGGKNNKLTNAMSMSDYDAKDIKKDMPFIESIERKNKLNVYDNILIHNNENFHSWNDNEFQESFHLLKLKMLQFFGDKIFNQLHSTILDQENTYSSQVQTLHDLIQFQRKIVMEAKIMEGTISFASPLSQQMEEKERRNYATEASKNEILTPLKLADRIKYIRGKNSPGQHLPIQHLPSHSEVDRSTPNQKSFTVCKFTWHR